MEEEIKKLEEELNKIRERQREYRNAGAYDQAAMESSNASKIAEQISILKNENAKSENYEVVKLEEELNKIRERQREYRNAGAYDQAAMESSNASKLVEQIAEFKNENVKIEKSVAEQMQEIAEEQLYGLGDMKAIEYLKNETKTVESEVIEPEEEKQETIEPETAKSQDSELELRIIAKNGTCEYKNEIAEGKTNIEYKRGEVIKYFNEEFTKAERLSIFENVENCKKLLKKVDPFVLNMLKNNRGIDACKDYIQSLDKGTIADFEKYNYSIKYDIRGLKKNKNLKFWDRIKLKRLANKSKAIGADVIEDPKSRNRILALITGGALFLSSSTAIPGAFKDKETQKNEPTKPEITLDKEKEENSKLNQSNEFTQNLKVSNEIQQEIQKAQQEKDEKQKVKNITLGDTVYIDEGINYHENALEQGKEGEVGKTQWRPSGEYMIDGVAIKIKDSNSIVKLDGHTDGNYGDLGLNVNDYVKQIMEQKGLSEDDIQVMYHINMGGNSNYTKENGKYKGGNPTGWIEKSEDGYKVINEHQDKNKTVENVR